MLAVAVGSLPFSMAPYMKACRTVADREHGATGAGSLGRFG